MSYTNVGDSGLQCVIEAYTLIIKQDAAVSNSPYIREVPLASGQGFASADSAAKLFGVLANGGKYGSHEVLSEAGIHKLGEPIISGIDRVFLQNITYGRGTTLIKGPHVSLHLPV